MTSNGCFNAALSPAKAVGPIYYILIIHEYEVAQRKSPGGAPRSPICHFVIRGTCDTATATVTATAIRTVQLYQDQVVGVPAPALGAEKGHLYYIYLGRDKDQHLKTRHDAQSLLTDSRTH